LQDAPRNFGGKLAHGGFDIAARRGEFGRNAFFCCADFARGFRPGGFELCGARIE
jgi:hypothetical protein